MALAIVVDAKKSISANQLKTHLGIGSYRTAWYLAHRIRPVHFQCLRERHKELRQFPDTGEKKDTYGKPDNSRYLAPGDRPDPCKARSVGTAKFEFGN
ncbi:MAG: hypothetical protein WA354_21745 [Terracidiphilus sp.]